MKREILYTILLSMLLVYGCDNKAAKTVTNPNFVASATNELNLHSTATKSVASDSADLEKRLIEDAEKNYLNAYNRYVQSLRESGPQTMETLQALCVYQKNYQIYQMLLKAENKNK